MKCIPDKKRLLNDWLFYFLKSDVVQKKIIGLSTRVRQSGVRPDDLDELQIPLPPIDIQKEAILQIEEEQKLVETNKKLIQLFEQKIKDKIEEVWGG
jgi:type I restriction enzyme M protein